MGNSSTRPLLVASAVVAVGDARAAAAEIATAGAAVVVTAFTVLLVEDDSAVRDYVVQLLREKGIAALVAADAMAALQILARHQVDVLFTDIVMPGMSGLNLAKEAKRLRPAIKILFSTGWPGKSVDHSALRLGAVLLKPWREGELMQELRRLGWSG